MNRKLLLTVLGLSLAAALGIWGLVRQRSKGPEAAASASPLYTGKEPKRKLRLSFPSAEKPGFFAEEGEIYATASQVAQLKQALNLFLAGPKSKQAAPAFPAGSAWREVFLTADGLLVIDLDGAFRADFPGGTSWEYLSLDSLVKTALENFRDAKQVQVLIDGKIEDSLAGHMDISRPLTLADF